MKKEPTEIREFALKSLSRHELSQSLFQKQIEDELLVQQAEKSKFRALPLPKSARIKIESEVNHNADSITTNEGE